MGKATIKNALGNGQYEATVNYDLTSVDAKISALQARRTAKLSELSAAYTEYTNALLVLDAAISSLDVAIDAYRASQTEENRNAMTDAMVEVEEAQAIVEVTLQAWKIIKLELLSIGKELERLEDITDYDATVWCADYNDALSGVVGTIEVNGDTDTILVKPAGVTANAAWSSNDGQLRPILGMSRYESFYNTAILPGWQKWKPTYRTGTVAAIDGDSGLGTITLDEATSNAQGLGINQGATLNGVAFEYLDCNEQAFATGDAVVVKFDGQDWTSPKVVGFASNPKQCAMQIRITFGTTTGNAAFDDLADERISAIQTNMGLLDYAAEEFVPGLLGGFQGLVGFYRVIAYGVPINSWTQQDVNIMKEPWQRWLNGEMGEDDSLGYPQSRALYTEGLSNWGAAKVAAANLSSSAKCTNTGCIDPEDDISSVDLSDAVIVVDCCYGDPIPDLLANRVAMNVQDERTRSRLVEAKWDDLFDECSPVCETSIYVDGLISFSWQARGYIDTDGNFYYFTRNVQMVISGGYGVPEYLSVEVSFSGESAVFKIPSSAEYFVNIFEVGELGPESGTLDLNMTVSIVGRARPALDGFGSSWTYTSPPYYPSIKSLHLTHSTDPREMVLREGYQLFGSGVIRFAGKYFDHPIVTGEDVLDVIPGLDALSTADEVISEMEHEFNYKSDNTAFDNWSFLNSVNPDGDCEDFAITAIQRMMERGISISRMKIEFGEISTPKKLVGHLWVVVDNSFAMDRSIKTLGQMDIYINRMVQTDGMEFELRDDGRIVSFPYLEWDLFDAPIIDAECTMTRAATAAP